MLNRITIINFFKTTSIESVTKQSSSFCCLSGFRKLPLIDVEHLFVLWPRYKKRKLKLNICNMFNKIFFCRIGANWWKVFHIFICLYLDIFFIFYCIFHASYIYFSIVRLYTHFKSDGNIIYFFSICKYFFLLLKKIYETGTVSPFQYNVL